MKVLSARQDRAPGILLPYQKKWIEDRAAVKIIAKSRRIGITWTEAAEDSLFAARSNGSNVFYIGFNYDMTREFIDDCVEWSRHFNLAASEVEEFVFRDDNERTAINAFRIYYNSGHRIEALSSRPTNLRGKQGKIVIDEAAFHEDLPGLIKAAMALLIWGSQVVIISTHNGDDNYFNELVYKTLARKTTWSYHFIDLDMAIAQGLYDRIRLRAGGWSMPGYESTQDGWRQWLIDTYGDDADEELFCIPSKGDRNYLPTAAIKACMRDHIPLIEYAKPDDFMYMSDSYRRGEDFARNGHLTVVWVIQETEKAKLEVVLALEERNIPFRQQEQILFYICDNIPFFGGGALDSRGNGQAIAEYAIQRYGARRIHLAMLSNQWYSKNFPLYKDAIINNDVLIPQSSAVLDDHRAVKKIKGIPKLDDKVINRSKSARKRHGDSAIAGLLGVYAATEIQPVRPISGAKLIYN